MKSASCELMPNSYGHTSALFPTLSPSVSNHSLGSSGKASTLLPWSAKPSPSESDHLSASSGKASVPFSPLPWLLHGTGLSQPSPSQSVSWLFPMLSPSVSSVSFASSGNSSPFAEVRQSGAPSPSRSGPLLLTNAPY